MEGAGWSGTWVFRVTYDAETENVWFQTSLAQRKGTFGTTTGGDQVGSGVIQFQAALFVATSSVHSFCFTPYIYDTCNGTPGLLLKGTKGAQKLRQGAPE